MYERHLGAWEAYLAEGNAKQARKAVGADVILRDGAGKLLLVDPRYKPDWDLPGGMAEAALGVVTAQAALDGLSKGRVQYLDGTGFSGI